MRERPLEGRRIVVTRAAAQSAALLETLHTLGATPIAAPAIRILPPEDPQPLAEALRQLERVDWLVCTSANAVRAVQAARGPDATWPSTLRIAAVGTATTVALRAAGAAVTFTPSQAVADALGRELPVAPGDRILWPHGDLAGPALIDALTARGAQVLAPVAYRTVSDAGSLGVAEILRDGHVDAITFTSGSTVRHVVEGLTASGIEVAALDPTTRPLIVCIGPVTASAARDCGLPVDAVAASHDDAGLLDALLRCFASRSIAV